MNAEAINNGQNQIHVINLELISLDKGHLASGEWVGLSDHKPYWEKMVLKVAGLNYAGFSVGFVPEGYAARQVTKGPFIPGPWVYAFANAGVIDNHGGTRAELDKAQAEGRIVNAQLGDYLMIDGFGFKIEPDHNRNIKLTRQDPPDSDQVNAEGAAAKRKNPRM